METSRTRDTKTSATAELSSEDTAIVARLCEARSAFDKRSRG